MDDNELSKLPEDTSALSADPSGRRTELEISGEEVYLPSSEVVKPGDDRYREIVTEALPPEIGPAISEEALGHYKGYSAAAVLLILVFLGAGIVMFWRLIPRPVELKSTDIGIPLPEKTRYSGRFAAGFRRAQEQIGERKYAAARETLRPLVEALLDGETIPAEEDPVFYAYFDLLHGHLNWSGDDRELLGRLREKRPDEFRWQLFHILNSPELAIRDGHLQTPDEQRKSVTERSSGRQIRDRMTVIDELRKRHHDDDKLVERLDLYKCYLDLYLWRRKNLVGPDDEKGQDNREEAFRIALRYRGNRDFIKVRRYIIGKMLEDGTSGYYVFNGQKYYMEKHLKNALGELEKEARGGGQNK